MKQLDLFGEIANQKNDNQKKKSQWTLFVDGASRNNPGPSAAGIYLVKDGVAFEKDGFYLGNKTNNEAEYLALFIGLFYASEYVQNGDTLHIISDSQLLVRQIIGQYRVRQPHLKLIHDLCKQEIHRLCATIAHVLREENTVADAMANQGIKTKQFPPKKCRELLKNHGIVV